MSNRPHIYVRRALTVGDCVQWDVYADADHVAILQMTAPWSARVLELLAGIELEVRTRPPERQVGERDEAADIPPVELAQSMQELADAAVETAQAWANAASSYQRLADALRDRAPTVQSGLESESTAPPKTPGAVGEET